MDAHNVTTEAVIAIALQEARARISAAERDRADIEKTLAVAREEERLLQRLLALRRGPTPSSVPEDEAAIGRNMGEAHGAKNSALSAVIEELTAAGRPLHVSELMRLLREKQIPIPGAGMQANLIAHMRRNKEIVRPSRGMYALASWGLEDAPTKSGRRRRKRVRARADSKEQ